MNPLPDWASELTVQVCKDYKRTLPNIKWLDKKEKTSSSGVTYMRPRYEYNSVPLTTAYGQRYVIGKKKRGSKYNILVRAGADIKDQRLVLLHELAHYLLAKSKKGLREHHSLRFWRLAFALYDKYEVGIDYAYEREKHYMQKAKWAYTELVAEKMLASGTMTVYATKENTSP